MDRKAKLDEIYMPYIYKWGKITNTLGMLAGFIPVIYLGLVYKMWPQWGVVFQGWLAMAGILGYSWVMQPIQYFAILGVAGTYMSNISGQIGNMRVPCSIAAEKACGVSEGTPESELIANIASAVSTFINIIVLAIGVIGGAAALAAAPAVVQQSLNYVLPSLMGICIIMIGWGRWKDLAVGVIVATVVRALFTFVIPSLNGFIDITVIILAIAINIWLVNKKMAKS